MKRLITPLAVSLACATQPAIEQTPVIDQSAQADSQKSDKPRFSDSEMQLLILLAQTNENARDLLRRSQREIEELTMACEMEKQGFATGEPVCTPYMLQAAQAQFCRFDQRFTSSVSQLEKKYPHKSEEGRVLLENLRKVIVELRQLWESFLGKYLPGSTC